MRPRRELVTFDWAMKKLLRSKVNFKVLEGFLSELLRDDITILEVLEGEGNKEAANDKHNRVDLLVKDKSSRRIIIEVQYSREDDYFQRILYGTAKVLTESLDKGSEYADIARVVSVSVVYFDLGQGRDYIYEGHTEFRGIHLGDRLTLSDHQRELYQSAFAEEIFPEYYILKVNNFDGVAKDGLDQWVYFLKNGSIKPSFTGKGLKEAQAAMDVMRLSESERRAYDYHLEVQRAARGVAQSTILRAENAERNLAEAKAKEAEAKAKEAEAKAKAEQAMREKDEIMAKAMDALIAQGMSEKQARKTLGVHE